LSSDDPASATKSYSNPTAYTAPAALLTRLGELSGLDPPEGGDAKIAAIVSDTRAEISDEAGGGRAPRISLLGPENFPVDAEKSPCSGAWEIPRRRRATYCNSARKPDALAASSGPGAKNSLPAGNSASAPSAVRGALPAAIRRAIVSYRSIGDIE
jgi:hypothetical protein